MLAVRPGERDLRIDFFRGLALLFIFIDHVPKNGLAHLTLQNFGFADAAEVFVLLAGYSAVLAYQRSFENKGFLAGVARVVDRVRDIYVWHLALVAISAIGLMWATAWSGNPMYARGIGVHVFGESPASAMILAAALINQPNMLNILPLYIVLLLAWMPFVLWLLPRRPWQTLFVSACLWLIANLLQLNLPSQQHPHGWVFSPFAWQLLLTVGALAAHFNHREAIAASRPMLALAASYVAFAFVMAAPWTQIAGLEGVRLTHPDFFGQMNKSYLSLWRLAHVVALGYLAMTLLSPKSAWLSRAWARGVGCCGRHSLEIFCLGTILSFTGWVIFVEAGDGLTMQILVNAGGIGILWVTAWALEHRNREIGYVRVQLLRWRSQSQRV